MDLRAEQTNYVLDTLLNVISPSVASKLHSCGLHGSIITALDSDVLQSSKYYHQIYQILQAIHAQENSLVKSHSVVEFIDIIRSHLAKTQNGILSGSKSPSSDDKIKTEKRKELKSFCLCCPFLT